MNSRQSRKEVSRKSPDAHADTNLKENFRLERNLDVEANSRLSDKAKKRLASSKSANTLKAYGADWSDFTDWCRAKKCSELPAAPETIVNYMTDLADNAKANTISRRVTAISENHIAAGYDAGHNPAKSGLVRAAMASIRREKGTYQQGKAPILLDTLYVLADYFTDDILGARDRAIILLGFAGAFRRSELARIQFEELTFSPQGLAIFIPQSKGDQLGRGATIGIPYAPDEKICAVRAVKKWLDLSGIKKGSLFRSFKKNHELNSAHLSDKSIALVVKKYAKLAGFNEKDFAGHSLRRGFATSAAQHNVDTLGIMKQTRHKSERMVHRYIEQGGIFKDNPLANIYKRR